MKAMVFAAGVGSRLKELTVNKPKCLMEAGGKTLLEHVIDRLKAAGVKGVMINVHHHADQVEAFVRSRRSFGITVKFSAEESLLDTGGGLLRAKEFFEGQRAFFVHNSDIYSSCDLAALRTKHDQRKAVATVAVMDRASKRGLYFDNEMALKGWTGENPPYSPKAGEKLLAFCGISVVSAEIFQYMEDEKVFSIVKPFLKASKVCGRVWGEQIVDPEWTDVGTPETLRLLQERLA